jgi:RNA polymerase sigma-70 factor (ECF subfamily)
MSRSFRRSESPFDSSPERIVVAKDSPTASEFSNLYTYYFEKVFRYFEGNNIPAQDAEDLAQTVMIRVYRALSRYEERGSKFSGWVFTIARNILLNFFRDQKRESSNVIFLDPADYEFVDVPVQENFVENVEEHLYKTPEDLLDEAISHLSEEYKAILFLQGSGMTHEEIAQRLGLTSEGASKSKLGRARKQIYDYLVQNKSTVPFR